jgi:hypothetical protein
LKKRVFRPIGDFILSRLENGWELFFEVSNYNERDLRLLVWPVFEALEGKWGRQGIVDQRRTTVPEVGYACGE